MGRSRRIRSLGPSPSNAAPNTTSIMNVPTVPRGLQGLKARTAQPSEYGLCRTRGYILRTSAESFAPTQPRHRVVNDNVIFSLVQPPQVDDDQWHVFHRCCLECSWPWKGISLMADVCFLSPRHSISSGLWNGSEEHIDLRAVWLPQSTMASCRATIFHIPAAECLALNGPSKFRNVHHFPLPCWCQTSATTQLFMNHVAESE